MKYAAVTIAFVLIGSMSLLAQDGDPSEMDEMYVPDENSIFGGGSDNDGGSYADVKNTIKFNPTLITRSIIAVFYERYLVDDLSIQVGLGTCFAKDRILGLGSEIGSLTDDYSVNVPLGTIMRDGTFNSNEGNKYLSVATRFFWGTYYSDYNYFEVAYRFYSNTMTVDAQDPAEYYGYIKSTSVVSVRNSIFFMTYGFQVLTDGSVTTAHDFYIGFGLRNTSYDKFNRETVEDPWGYVIDEYYVKSSTERESILGFSMIIGYAFGFGF